MEQNKYARALIYTIKTMDGIYVGSTIDFKERVKKHFSDCRCSHHSCYNSKLYRSIRKNDGVCTITIHKMFPCDNLKELRIEEERVRRELNANLNHIRAYRTEEERKEYQKCYLKTNRDKLKKQCKEYYYRKKAERLLKMEQEASSVQVASE